MRSIIGDDKRNNGADGDKMDKTRVNTQIQARARARAVLWRASRSRSLLLVFGYFYFSFFLFVFFCGPLAVFSSLLPPLVFFVLL